MAILFESLLLNLATLLLIIATSIYLYIKHSYTYWDRKNVPYLEPKFFFGNTKPMVTMTECLGECLAGIYNDLKQKTKRFGGYYIFTKPVLLILDPDLIKQVLIKDFTHFHDRMFAPNEDLDPLALFLVTLTGTRWKTLRNKITPTFTSGKMKYMFNTIVTCTKEMKVVLNKHIENSESIDIRDILARLTTDTIGSCAFGLDCNSLKNPDTDFRRYGKMFFEPTFKRNLRDFCSINYPKLLSLLKIPSIDPELTNFFVGVIKDTVEYRQKNKIQKNDFLDLLIRLYNNQSVLDEHFGNTEANPTPTEGITFNEMASQAFVFFIAGFETTSSTLNFCLYELVLNMEIQKKVRKEVMDVLGNHNGEISYDAIMEMKYMDKVVSEVLRKYPPLPMLMRLCTKDFNIPDTDIVINKGIEVWVSTLGIQRDPLYYPDPEIFDPERFSEEQKSKRHPYAYLPFGEGPRICIGMRFALLQIKIALSVLLKNYNFTLDPATKIPLQFNPKTIFLTPNDKILLRASRLEEK